MHRTFQGFVSAMFPKNFGDPTRASGTLYLVARTSLTASQQGHNLRFPGHTFGVIVLETVESLLNEFIGVRRTASEAFSDPVTMGDFGGFQPALGVHHADALR